MGISAIGKSLSSGRLVDSDYSSPWGLIVEDTLASPITDIEVEPNDFTLPYLGAEADITIMGLLPNGRHIRLADSTQLVVQSLNPNVAQIGPNNSILATGIGKTQVSVSYLSFSKMVAVEVKGHGVIGDLDGDGDADSQDLLEIETWINRPASGPADARDMDHDGRITQADADMLIGTCTRTRCATSNNLQFGMLPESPAPSPSASPGPSVITTARGLIVQAVSLAKSAKAALPAKPSSKLAKSKKLKINSKRNIILKARKSLPGVVNQLVNLEKNSGSQIRTELKNLTKKRLASLKTLVKQALSTKVPDSKKKKTWSSVFKILSDLVR